MSSTPRTTRHPSSTPVILYARHEHGGFPVHVRGDTYEVHWSSGVSTYTSARQLLRALYNNGDVGPRSKDPGMTFDKYFKLDRLDDTEVTTTVFDLFSNTPLRQTPRLPRTRRSQKPRHRCPASAGRWYRGPIVAAFSTLALFGSLELAKAKPTPVEEQPFAWADSPPGKLSVEEPTSTTHPQALSVAPHILGIDLAARGHEVRKLLYKGFGARIARKGLDIEDVLQEVYKGIMTRNKGKCPFDPRKSSFGHYVHMVCRCILSNYERKVSRQHEVEQVGMYVAGGSDDEGMVDAALGATNLQSFGTSELEVESSAGTNRAFSSLLSVIETKGRDSRGKLRPEAELAARCLPLVYEGHQRAEIARVLDVDPSRVGRALAFLRRSATEWSEEEGLIG